MQNIDLICVGKLNAKYFAEGVVYRTSPSSGIAMFTSAVQWIPSMVCSGKALSGCSFPSSGMEPETLTSSPQLVLYSILNNKIIYIRFRNNNSCNDYASIENIPHNHAAIAGYLI